jgi:hypothetical protein
MTSRDPSLSLAAVELPQPKVLEADGNGDILDLTKHLGDFTVTVDKWPRPLLSLLIRGRNDSGNLVNLQLYEKKEISNEQFKNGLNEKIPRAELMKLVNYSSMTVNGMLNLDGHIDLANGKDFEPLSLTIKTKKTDLDELTDFNDKTFDNWTQGTGQQQLEFIEDAAHGGYYLANKNYSQRESSGVILEKTFLTDIGTDYEFTLNIKRGTYGSSGTAVLTLNIDDKNSTEKLINHTDWKNYSFVATATTHKMTVRLINNKPGSDTGFSIDNLRIKSLPAK